ncbi:MAG: hypothetical protein FRX49_06326 [Trebouxia sp. A1-2]|nr:MAG: hypothetical protein FRX49_06326 [Trebouxia sp. A1-2]
MSNLTSTTHWPQFHEYHANGMMPYSHAYLVYFAEALEKHTNKRHVGQTSESTHRVYKALDCVCLGTNRHRGSLEPMLKVWGTGNYIRADSHYEKHELLE